MWESLGLWSASVGEGSGAVGATVAGKKFSLLSLGCLGVVGVSPEACDNKGKVRKGNGAASEHVLPRPTPAQFSPTGDTMHHSEVLDGRARKLKHFAKTQLTSAHS